jgi:hypothetical protein
VSIELVVVVTANECVIACTTIVSIVSPERVISGTSIESVIPIGCASKNKIASDQVISAISIDGVVTALAI